MPKISVILPVYNAEKFLNECLESLLNQSFKDFEIIAINDGSTDYSLELLKKYLKKDSRLRIISRENRGITKTLNEGISLSKGEYIARMDADDICFPERFESQLKILEKYNYDLCGTQIEKFGSISGISNYPISCEDCYRQLFFKSSFAHSSIMVKKAILTHFKYNEEIRYAQDYDLWCRMALNKVRMCNLPTVLLRFRCSSGQISSSKHYLQLQFAQKIAKNYWKFNDMTKDIYYPLCLLDSRNNSEEELKKSLDSLSKLQNRIHNTNYINNYIIKKQFNLLIRLSSCGLKKIRKYIIINKNINYSKKIFLEILGLTRLMKLIFLIKNKLPANILNVIRNFDFYKNLNN